MNETSDPRMGTFMGHRIRRQGFEPALSSWVVFLEPFVNASISMVKLVDWPSRWA